MKTDLKQYAVKEATGWDSQIPIVFHSSASLLDIGGQHKNRTQATIDPAVSTPQGVSSPQGTGVVHWREVQRYGEYES